MTARPLVPEEHARLADAIRRAESGTAGEIYVVVARASDSYFHPAALMLTIGSMLAGIAAALVLHWLWIDIGVPAFALAQAAALGSAIAVIWLAPGLRIHLTPRGLRRRRAHDNAMKQFLAHNVHRTAERTGVLIFVSLAERYAEIVADSGIDRHADAETWSGIIARLTDMAGAGRLAEGLEAAVGEAGALLARHVPARPGDRNELGDHVVEI